MNKEIKVLLRVYLINWIIFIGLVLSIAFRSDVTLSYSIDILLQLLQNSGFILLVHTLFIVLYLLFLVIRYFVRLYRKSGLRRLLLQVSFRALLPVILLLTIYQLVVSKNHAEQFNYVWDYSVENKSDRATDLYSEDQKHRGMHVFDLETNDREAIDELVKNNIEWVALVPYFYQKDENTQQINFTKRNFSRKDSALMGKIEQLHKRGIKVMLKPHVWLGSGWRANINFKEQTDWEKWFISYKNGLFHYAKLAALSNVELLCVGTELKSSIQNQPEDWKGLIRETKLIYNGELTYAANWDDEYKHVSFWNSLDYIGIQAYFPLTNEENPELKTIKEGWKKPIELLESLSKKHNKPILFTEVGYKSESTATNAPWEWDDTFSSLFKKKSDKTQQLAFEALFQTLWKRDWFAGVYIWQWNTRSKKKSASGNLDFSPRFKPAENIIAKWFGEAN